MIALTRPNGQPVMLNCDLIESVEIDGPSTELRTVETIVTLTTGNVVVVRESLEEIERKVVAFKRAIFAAQEHRE
ncbi:MAG: flagellar FlbD family protein [Candidatus Cybelea sp.]